MRQEARKSSTSLLKVLQNALLQRIKNSTYSSAIVFAFLSLLAWVATINFLPGRTTQKELKMSELYKLSSQDSVVYNWHK